MHHAGAAQAAAPAAAEPVQEPEKTEFDVKLEGFDAAAKIKVIKEVRVITELGLKEAKELVRALTTKAIQYLVLTSLCLQATLYKASDSLQIGTASAGLDETNLSVYRKQYYSFPGSWASASQLNFRRKAFKHIDPTERLFWYLGLSLGFGVDW